MKRSITAVVFCAILPMCVDNCRCMLPERESFDFMTPLGAFVDWSCNHREGALMATGWIALVSLFKSDKYGGRNRIDKCVYMYDTSLEYFKYFKSDGFYDDDDHKTDGILSLYPAFAEAFGNTDDPLKPECYYVAAKENEDLPPSDRRKSDMLHGIGEDFTLNCDGGVGNTRRVNAFLQLLLLMEIADRGSANNGSLDHNNWTKYGYDMEMLSKFYKLMSVIIEE